MTCIMKCRSNVIYILITKCYWFSGNAITQCLVETAPSQYKNNVDLVGGRIHLIRFDPSPEFYIVHIEIIRPELILTGQ